MFKFELEGKTRYLENRTLDRFFLVKRAGTDRVLFVVSAYAGSCCGISILSAVTDYPHQGELKAALKWVSGLYAEGKHTDFFSWDMKSFIWFAGPGQHYIDKAAAMGMEEVFRFTSRSEPGHDVVQYFVDLSEEK